MSSVLPSRHTTHARLCLPSSHDRYLSPSGQVLLTLPESYGQRHADRSNPVSRHHKCRLLRTRHARPLATQDHVLDRMFHCFSFNSRFAVLHSTVTLVFCHRTSPHLPCPCRSRARCHAPSYDSVNFPLFWTPFSPSPSLRDRIHLCSPVFTLPLHRALT